MELLKNLEGLTPDEQMTAVVELQKAAMQHLEEQKQASIGKSAELVIQGLKKIKYDFEERFNSLNYDIQTKVASLKDGEQGLQGPKGDQGERGLDGSNGRDGRDGKDGKDGVDGVDGVGVRDAKIDFDGSLVISLTDGREINCGEVVSVDVAKQIQKVTHNIQTGAGGDSQTVLDAIAALQATIATYGTMATQNANNVAITGGNINNTVIGGTTPAAGTFTTLTATGQTSLGGTTTTDVVRIYRNNTVTSDTASFTAPALSFIPPQAGFGAGILRSSAQLNITTGTTGSIVLQTASTLGFGGTTQAQVSHTASAVNYVQVTGAATGSGSTISAQGSDTNVGLAIRGKGSGFVSIGQDTTTQFAVSRTSSAVNYFLASGGIAGNAPTMSAFGSDTNISQVFQSKGTGAIDLAAGSSGVNISNGGTVTAITGTAAGSGYTSIPTVNITAPTTAGGVQATATVAMAQITTVIATGGTGYTVNDVLTFVGGTGTAMTVTVTTVSAGVITGLTVSSSGTYTVLPTNPISVTGGTGTGATFNVNAWQIRTSGFTITNAGSGYVEQPTVTFSGGGGSGAAAYATVGSIPTLKTVGSALSLATPSGEAFRVVDLGATTTNYVRVLGSASGGSPLVSVAGTDSNINLAMSSVGTSSVIFRTASNSVEQARVSHTASAVNYVQVTGAATGSGPIISSQGSDTNVALDLRSKGTSSIFFRNAGGGTQLAVNTSGAGTNYLQVASAATTVSPVLSAQGSDTNIDLTLTPKGTGLVRFGTYTAGAPTATGYISIKAADGTTYKVLVGT